MEKATIVRLYQKVHTQAAISKALGHAPQTVKTWVDRKRFDFKGPGVNVRGESWQAQHVNHPHSVNMYIGLTIHGIAKAHLVTGTSKLKSDHLNKKGEAAKNITTTEYKDV